MIGAIAGDIIGSVYEATPIKSKDFPLFHRRAKFTDDSVLTVAVAHAILEDALSTSVLLPRILVPVTASLIWLRSGEGR